MEDEAHVIKLASIQMEPFPVAVNLGSISLDMFAMVKPTSAFLFIMLIGVKNYLFMLEVDGKTYSSICRYLCEQSKTGQRVKGDKN